MKKFLCYDTNDAASGKINVSANGVLKPNSTVPSTNGAANQQLVTDADGNVKWEDKLTYVTHEWVDYQLPNIEEDICVITNFTLPEVGQTVLVKLDGVESIETVKAVTDDEDDPYTYIGSIDPVSLRRSGSGWCIYGFVNDYGLVEIVGEQSADKVVQSVSLYCSIIHKIDKKFIPGNSVSIGHDEEDENGDYLFVESYNPFGIVKVLDSNNEWDKSLITFDNSGYLSLQDDVFIIRKITAAGWITLSDIPTSVGEKFEAVENRSFIIEALSSQHEYLIQYNFSFNNGVIVRSYLSKLGNENSKFASAVVSAENGMVYSITLKLNSDNKTAKVVFKCIA